MALENPNIQKIALFVDGDNFPAHYLPPLLEELLKVAPVPIRRVFGNWTMEKNQSWQDLQFENALELRQQSQLTTHGKNAADIALAIDAYGEALLHHFDTIVIAGHDTDYTPLLLRVRQLGVNAIIAGLQGELPDVLTRSANGHFILPRMTDIEQTRENTLVPVIPHNPQKKHEHQKNVACLKNTVNRLKEKRHNKLILSELGNEMKRQGLTPEDIVKGEKRWRNVLAVLFGQNVTFYDRNQRFHIR